MPRRFAVAAGIVAFLFFLYIGFSAVFSHALLRQTADEPQHQMALRYAQRLAQGDRLSILPQNPVNLANDLDPFVAVYDDNGTPLHSNGILDGASPVPPAGVFAATRQRGVDKLTWQPRHGVRIALVAVRVNGPHPGFVLAGRSLAVTENSEQLIYMLAFISMIVFPLAVVLFVLLARRGHSVPAPSAA